VIAMGYELLFCEAGTEGGTEGGKEVANINSGIFGFLNRRSKVSIKQNEMGKEGNPSTQGGDHV